MHRISVVIPTYNRADLIAEAIDSALAQTRRPDEIVVIDNDSEDNTREVVARYPAVRYVWQPNQGICGSANRGIREATGDYLVLLHSDDRLTPDHLETSLRAFRSMPQAAFVCGDYRWFGADGTWHVHRCQPSPDYYGTLLRLNFIGPPVVIMFKRDILLRMGGFRSEYEGADDQELYLRIARTYPIYCHHGVVAEYRRHGSQASQNHGRMFLTSMAMLRAQWRFIRGSRLYREAYRAGVRYRQELYGSLVFWQGVNALRARRWKEAGTCFAALARFHPRGLLIPLLQKLTRPFVRHVPIPSS